MTGEKVYTVERPSWSIYTLSRIITWFLAAELVINVVILALIYQSDFFALVSASAALIAVSVTTIILFFIWVYRANRNLRYLSVGYLRFTPGWAVGWFFIPIMNLFRPYQVMSEMWKASDPKADTTDAEAWKRSSTSPLIGWWWAFTIIYSIVSYVGPVAMYPIDIVWVILTIFMVRRITERQEEKHRLITMTSR